jgi:hypothetical protein
VVSTTVKRKSVSGSTKTVSSSTAKSGRKKK